ncbi:3-hydroxyacyl-CoA dehydrogenase NAD-binding domain-containing protein [Roseinatronobacter sp. S2]|uniref:3-hydroxyacyl-CoA dehydrogenase NAD-binding domain-containing protein n=1 Tax=Roseinatronobacter sp. S2 TaxID=3035471 RepID=UPI00240FA2B3|nr:3-hydroxyacyl-CoA dehydrogenase NAD-binding domain-containing protein [Roseinatronobacter sp. S2]WFE76972.1 3-hydroxyacyl-CoA dehydrogenase NAD-binding domain-containing protein [Roseinatronobacter sp. S2]
MTMQVTLEKCGQIAVLTIDRPPVNALSQDLRALVCARIKTVGEDDGVLGLVIACAGRTFVAGADITELGQVLPPMLRDVIDTLEGLGKPSVAALHGTALGGGFELALGCTFRVATRDARIGLPEVRLGILPGAGGTVRATYLAGALAALELAGSGEMMAAVQARDLGLIDEICEGNPVDAALHFLRARITCGPLPPPVSARRGGMPDSNPAALDRTEADLCRKARSSAPALVGAAVRAAVAQPFDAAMTQERQLFDAAVASPRSAALRHLFLAERAAAKPSGDVVRAEIRQAQRIGVIGAGTMGRGIAMAFANAGFDVTVCEADDSALAQAMERIAGTYTKSVTRGSLAPDQAEIRRSRITGATGLVPLAQADLIIEAAFEDIAVKCAIFAELDRIAPPGAILATNTSYLDINTIARATSRPQDILGLHFFSPAHVMKLVEIVRGDNTAPEVLATALAVTRRLDKQPVVVGVCHGFVGNRMLAARNSHLSALLLEGADPAQVDAAFRRFGWPMGPCQMHDMAGLDIGWRRRKSLGVTDSLPDRLCELGRFGQKAGMGWYTYRGGDRVPQPAPEVGEIIAGIAAAHNIARRELSDAEIIERTHSPMIAEGRKILAEGIATRSSDIDVIWVHGYGFPRDLGGPMFWDDQGRPDPALL